MSLADFCGAPETAVPARKYAREVSDHYRLEPHVCRACFSRIASKMADGGRRHFECTGCGLVASGRKPDCLCACGMRLRAYRSSGGTSQGVRDAGIRCHENRNRSPEFPAVYVASHGGAQAEG